MDIPTLAHDLVLYLTPFLPYLQKAGETVGNEAAKKFGEGMWEKAKQLWGKVSPQVAAQEGAKGAVEVLAREPEESLLRGPVEYHFAKILKADPGLASEIAELLKAAGPRANWAQVVGDGAIAQGDGAVASSKNGIAAGGDVVIGAPWPGMPGGPRNRG
jgi:hypothetical protein